MTRTLPIRLDHDSAPDETLHVTASGLPVRIYATDGFIAAPIHGAIYIGGGWKPKSWLPSGRYESSVSEHPFDLRDRAPVKRGVWVAWWDSKNGISEYITKRATENEARIPPFNHASELIALHYLEEGDGLDTPAGILRRE